MTFKALGLVEPILKAIEEVGHVTPTPIQEQAIPHILQNKDVLGCAQTGTGKTAAFVLPLIQHLITKNDISVKQKVIKVLVLSPTRELAIQTRDNFRKYSTHTDLKCGVILGGVNQNSQVEVLKKGVDILVATPGRLLDLINQRYIKLNQVEVLVLDEADTMLDMGFIHDVKKIISYIPVTRQTLLLSATMPTEVNNLANTFLKNPITIKINSASPTVEKINQSIYFVDKNNKQKLLIEILNKDHVKSVLIFTRTKHGADKLATTLSKTGITCEVIHGNKSQNARVKALNNFKNGKSKVLIATDIAARGIDIIELSHVINYEIPNLAETYVHRIGRTGRAGLNGTAISLCDISEKEYLRNIEKLIKQIIPVIEEHNYPMTQLNFTANKQNRKASRGYNKKSNRSFKGNNNNFKKTDNKPYKKYHQNKNS
jgi:ATP-dependent RNA helicase RhlE